MINGQAEPVLTNAVRINGMPLANVHAYSFPVGKHTLMLPKGYLQVLGFTLRKRKFVMPGLPGMKRQWIGCFINGNISVK